MTIRRDHVAGIALLAFCALVLALGAELPFGTAASPGPGMMPVISIALMALFAAVLLIRAGSSPPLATIAWDDLPHALRVIVVVAAAAALYTTLGFVLTFGPLLIVLLYGVERMPLLPSLLIGIGMTGGAYLVLGTLLKAPLPIGIFGF